MREFGRFRRSCLFQCTVSVFDHQGVEQALVLTAAGVKDICNPLLHGRITAQCGNRLCMYRYSTADTGGGVAVVIYRYNFIGIGSGGAEILVGKFIAAVHPRIHCPGADQLVAAGADLPEDPVAAGLVGFIGRPLDHIGGFRLLHGNLGQRSHRIVDPVCGICIFADIAAPVSCLYTDIDGGAVHKQHIGNLYSGKQIIVSQIDEFLECLIGFSIRIRLVLHDKTGQQQIIRRQNTNGVIVCTQLAAGFRTDALDLRQSGILLQAGRNQIGGLAFIACNIHRSYLIPVLFAGGHLPVKAVQVPDLIVKQTELPVLPVRTVKPVVIHVLVCFFPLQLDAGVILQRNQGIHSCGSSPVHHIRIYGRILHRSRIASQIGRIGPHIEGTLRIAGHIQGIGSSKASARCLIFNGCNLLPGLLIRGSL